MNELYIIIVLYNPSKLQLERIHSLKKNYNLIIIDNTPSKACLVNGENYIYIPLYENKGIAFAQNVGIRKAFLLDNCKYILFFDQDSNFDSKFPEAILREFKKNEKLNSKIVALGPQIINKSKNKPYKQKIPINNSKNIIFTDTLISSGTIIPVWALKVVGLMEERLFIDYVDFEWCWRAKKKGYICCYSLSIKLPHKVGEKDITIPFLPIILSSPIRYYYQYRNFIWLIKRKYVPCKWKIKMLLRKIFELLILPIVYTNNRKKTTIYIFKGIIDGLKK